MFTKTDRNYLADIVLIIASVVCIFTGLFFNSTLRFAHEMSGYLMILLILVHLFLHLPWIETTTKSIFSHKTKSIALLLTIVVSISVCASFFLYKSAGYQGRNGYGHHLRNSPGLRQP